MHGICSHGLGHNVPLQLGCHGGTVIFGHQAPPNLSQIFQMALRILESATFWDGTDYKTAL
jgi:hypothetical protein